MNILTSRMLVVLCQTCLPLHIVRATSWDDVNSAVAAVLSDSDIVVRPDRNEEKRIADIGRQILNIPFFSNLDRDRTRAVCIEMASKQKSTCLPEAAVYVAIASKDSPLAIDVCVRFVLDGQSMDSPFPYEFLNAYENSDEVIRKLGNGLTACSSFASAMQLFSKLKYSLVRELLVEGAFRRYSPSVTAGMLAGSSRSNPSTTHELADAWNYVKLIPGEPKAAYLGVFQKSAPGWKAMLRDVLADNSIDFVPWRAIVQCFEEDLPGLGILAKLDEDRMDILSRYGALANEKGTNDQRSDEISVPDDRRSAPRLPQERPPPVKPDSAPK